VRDLLGTAAGFALLPAAGHGLLRLACGRWPHRAYGPAAAVGLSWLAGVAALGALTTLVGVLGGPTRPLPVLAPALVLVAVAGLLPLPWARPEPGPPPAGARLGDAVAGAAGVLAAAWVALLAMRVPVLSNDEYALWMLKARALSQLGGLDPRVFTDTGAGYQHHTYPLVVPSLVAWLDGWAGRPTDAAAHLAMAVTLGALLAVTGAVLARLAGPAAAAVAVLLVVSTPTLLSRQSLRLMADVPLFAFGFGLAVLLLVVVTLPRDAPAGPWLAAAAVLGAGAIGTKAEGLAFAGIAFAAALLLATGRRWAVAVAGLAAALANAPWQLYAREHHLRNWVLNEDTLSPAHLRDVLPWTGHVLRGMAERWPGGSGLGAVLLVAAVPAAVLAVRAGRWRPVAFTAAVVLLDSAVLLAQYVVTAYGPASDPWSGPLLDSQLDVTVFRVALVPAALLAVAVPVFAGLALRAGETAQPAGFTPCQQMNMKSGRNPYRRASRESATTVQVVGSAWESRSTSSQSSPP
jgi:hypothetical protein